MTKKQFEVFREALRCLSFNGTTIKSFAERINMSPHTIYNYISGQKPSEKHYNYILYAIEKYYPSALAQGREIIEMEKENERRI